MRTGKTISDILLGVSLLVFGVALLLDANRREEQLESRKTVVQIDRVAMTPRLLGLLSEADR